MPAPDRPVARGLRVGLRRDAGCLVLVWGRCDREAVDDVVRFAACPGCGARFPDVTGPTHAYMTGSPGCWRAYGQLLAAQYTDLLRMGFHQLVVDSYAVQHPDGDDPRAIQSVGIHLMTLCLFLERGVDPVEGTRLHRVMLARPVLHRLNPPGSRGRLTVLHVPTDGAAEISRRNAYEWAHEAWHAWQPHHPAVRRWIEQTGLGGQP